MFCGYCTVMSHSLHNNSMVKLMAEKGECISMSSFTFCTSQVQGNLADWPCWIRHSGSLQGARQKHLSGGSRDIDTMGPKVWPTMKISSWFHQGCHDASELHSARSMASHAPVSNLERQSGKRCNHYPNTPWCLNLALDLFKITSM